MRGARTVAIGFLTKIGVRGLAGHVLPMCGCHRLLAAAPPRLESICVKKWRATDRRRGVFGETAIGTLIDCLVLASHRGNVFLQTAHSTRHGGFCKICNTG
ncbi:hypothetical protein J6590_027160 [Homalodisca vitripennis]|nr:hypothetical protein J6590_027160 [Homalodisca vitripennis]